MKQARAVGHERASTFPPITLPPHWTPTYGTKEYTPSFAIDLATVGDLEPDARSDRWASLGPGTRFFKAASRSPADNLTLQRASRLAIFMHHVNHHSQQGAARGVTRIELISSERRVAKALEVRTKSEIDGYKIHIPLRSPRSRLRHKTRLRSEKRCRAECEPCEILASCEETMADPRVPFDHESVTTRSRSRSIRSAQSWARY